jgi:hypothetical protein
MLDSAPDVVGGSCAYQIDGPSFGMSFLQEADKLGPRFLKEPMRGVPRRGLLGNLRGSVKESALLFFGLREDQEAGKWIHCAVSSSRVIKRNNKKLK